MHQSKRFMCLGERAKFVPGQKKQNFIALLLWESMIMHQLDVKLQIH